MFMRSGPLETEKYIFPAPKYLSLRVRIKLVQITRSVSVMMATVCANTAC